MPHMQNVVGAAGFEPTLTESESGVLPLNYAPRRGVLYIALHRFANKKYCARRNRIRSYGFTRRQKT